MHWKGVHKGGQKKHPNAKKAPQEEEQNGYLWTPWQVYNLMAEMPALRLDWVLCSLAREQIKELGSSIVLFFYFSPTSNKIPIDALTKKNKSWSIVSPHSAPQVWLHSELHSSSQFGLTVGGNTGKFRTFSHSRISIIFSHFKCSSIWSIDNFNCI